MTNKHLRTTNRSSGFTIVELLIVIVVIAILAAIAIVAYNGIQNRAHASRAAAIVDSYAKALEMYKVDHGIYPFTDHPLGIEACLGNTEDFPATSISLEGQCAPGNIGPTVLVNNDLNAALSAYMSPLPASDLPTISDESLEFRGIIYSASAHEGGGAAIIYILKGGQDCPRGDAYPFSEEGLTITQCATILTN